MFLISIIYDQNNKPDIVGIKCNNHDKTTVYKFKNEELNEVITPLYIHVLLQNFGLSWIIKNNKKLKFDIDQHCGKCMKNGPWYNTTI